MTNLKIFIIISIFFVSIIISFSNPAYGEEKKPSSIEERLIRLEEELKALSKRLEDGLKALNQRIDDTNKRIDDLRQDMNERFATLHLWLQITFGGVVLVIAGLIAQWLLMWQRLVKVETKVGEHLSETEKDRLIAFQREEIEMLKARLDKLEAGSD